MLVRARVLDTPDDPFAGGTLRSDDDAGLLVVDGVVAARGPFAEVLAAAPGHEVVDLRDGLLLPGFVDTHVHLPQVRVIAGLGMPLLEWLERCALPEEARLADPAYAASVATDFVSGLVQAGTTSALVFGAHFAPAVDLLFAEAAVAGLRVTAGLVVSDRLLRDDLWTTPQRAYDEGLALAQRWHGVDRARYAVTPRFSLSCGEPLLDACAALAREVDGAFVTSHINENVAEVLAVGEACSASYVDSYDRHGLLDGPAVLAHDVHPTGAELVTLAERGTAVAHCPTSNGALGSGLFPLARHLTAGVPVALGSDVGAGTGFSLLKEGLQAYFVQQLLGDAGHPLTPAHLLHLATTAGAAALGLPDVGHLGVGMRFDAQHYRPAPGSTLDVGLRHAASPDDALAKLFALGTPSDVRTVWVDGEVAHAALAVDA
ncbi:guanine deaminase [Nocardioides sp. CFH 31398]|uniref:guanine deaminase n=1 Tax=Nocardioides sp. CFH 31398 TaxID=2919579 RepID=UPI001F05A3B1|nr:guanine deaminase [Nocardioides sp. CFH 31398]MCH1867848.1 guanine deaminase [Nocardioides sp. CFH 31398]